MANLAGAMRPPAKPMMPAASTMYGNGTLNAKMAMKAAALIAHSALFLSAREPMRYAANTTIAVTAGHGYLIGVGAYVKFGSEDNGGAGYRVTAVTSAQITITPTLGANIADLAVIAPVVPSQTLGGTRIGGTSHGLTIDAVSVNPISLKYTINTGIVPMDKESSSAKPTGILRTSGRTVDLDHDVYFAHANMPYFSAAHFATQVLRYFQARYGANTAAARMLVNTDSTLVKVQGVPISDGEITVVKLMGRARQNSAANDEFSIVFS